MRREKGCGLELGVGLSRQQSICQSTASNVVVKETDDGSLFINDCAPPAIVHDREADDGVTAGGIEGFPLVIAVLKCLIQ
jgi:hypothetical protein